MGEQFGVRDNPPPWSDKLLSAKHAEAQRRLEVELHRLDRVVVAFSGGADSALVAWAATRTLGPDRAHVVTAVSPSLPSRHRAECAALARAWGMRWSEVHTDEMENAAYRTNDGDRCFYCKDALMDAVGPIAALEGATVVLGVNLDDLGDHRPGQFAASQRGARFPLVDAGFDKALVRAVSQANGLATWNKPAAACLASRLPYGTPVTLGRLTRVERAEADLADLGFDELRVRDYEDLARIEVPRDRLVDVATQAAHVVDVVRAAGFAYVTLDLDGLRSGNLNQVLGADGRLPG